MKKPSEMTNDELALELMSRVPLDSSRHDDIREAAFRLKRQVTLDADLRSDHKREVDDLAIVKELADALNDANAQLCKGEYCEKTTCCSECKASKNRSLIAKALETLDEK